MTEKELRTLIKECLIEEGVVGNYLKGKLDDYIDQTLGEVGRNIDRSIQKRISGIASKFKPNKAAKDIAIWIKEQLKGKDSGMMGALSLKQALSDAMNGANENPPGYASPSVVKSTKKLNAIAGADSNYVLANGFLNTLLNVDNVIDELIWGKAAKSFITKNKNKTLEEINDMIKATGEGFENGQGVFFESTSINQLALKLTKIPEQTKIGEMYADLQKQTGLTNKTKKELKSEEKYDKFITGYIKKLGLEEDEILWLDKYNNDVDWYKQQDKDEINKIFDALVEKSKVHDEKVLSSVQLPKLLVASTKERKYQIVKNAKLISYAYLSTLFTSNAIDTDIWAVNVKNTLRKLKGKIKSTNKGESIEDIEV